MIAVACILTVWAIGLTVYFRTDTREPLRHKELAQYIVDLWLNEAIDIWSE